MSVCPHLAKALDEVDAAIFTGPTLYEAEDRKALEEHIARWTRELERTKETWNAE